MVCRLPVLLLLSLLLSSSLAALFSLPKGSSKAEFTSNLDHQCQKLLHTRLEKRVSHFSRKETVPLCTDFLNLSSHHKDPFCDLKCKLMNKSESQGMCAMYNTTGHHMIGVHFVCFCCKAK